MGAQNTEPGLSMGAVVRATGIPANTLRTWERRYGFPMPDRTAGGHRVYAAEVVPRLRLVALALERGHRAAQVVPADVEDLRRLLGLGTPQTPKEADGAWMAAVKRLDAAGLAAEMRATRAQMSVEQLIAEHIAPFVHEIGEAWATGDLSVYQEHFASDQVKAFLAELWRPLSETSTGPTALLATLPGERHELGLQMLAVVVASHGWRVTYLGPDAPIEDIARAAEQADAAVVMISVTSGSDPAVAGDQLEELRAVLPRGIALVTGGAGAPEAAGVIGLADLSAAGTWLDAARA